MQRPNTRPDLVPARTLWRGRSIRAASRRNAPFVAVSIPSLPKEMLARELFGHEKGAFTGADRRSIGYIEAASGGVLFVDEIGDLTTELQVSLLRVFESRVCPRRRNGRYTCRLSIGRRYSTEIWKKLSPEEHFGRICIIG